MSALVSGLIVFALAWILIRPLLRQRASLPFGADVQAVSRRLRVQLEADRDAALEIAPANLQVMRAIRNELPKQGSQLRLRSYYLFDDGKLRFHQLRLDGLSSDFVFLQAVRRFVGESDERPVTGVALPEAVFWARLFVSSRRKLYVVAEALRSGGYTYRVGQLGDTDPVVGPVNP